MPGDNDKPMMACGHAANAYDDKGTPCCVICLGITPKAREVVPTADLSNRTARCDCGGGAPSRTTLAFFEHLPNEPFDRYYCGCHGWD